MSKKSKPKRLVAAVDELMADGDDRPLWRALGISLSDDDAPLAKAWRKERHELSGEAELLRVSGGWWEKTWVAIRAYDLPGGRRLYTEETGSCDEPDEATSMDVIAVSDTATDEVDWLVTADYLAGVDVLVGVFTSVMLRLETAFPRDRLKPFLMSALKRTLDAGCFEEDLALEHGQGLKRGSRRWLERIAMDAPAWANSDYLASIDDLSMLAGIPVVEDDVAEQVELLREAGHEETADLIDARGHDVALTIADRDNILSVLDDPSEGLAVLRGVLLHEREWRLREGLA